MFSFDFSMELPITTEKLFEPYNLDNSFVCFAETPKSFHGSRYQTHDKPRPSIQFTLF